MRSAIRWPGKWRYRIGNASGGCYALSPGHGRKWSRSTAERATTMPARKSDPESAVALATAAIGMVETAVKLFQVAIRVDRGESPNLEEQTAWDAPPQGSYAANREAMLAIGNLQIGIQR